MGAYAAVEPDHICAPPGEPLDREGDVGAEGRAAVPREW